MAIDHVPAPHGSTSTAAQAALWLACRYQAVTRCALCQLADSLAGFFYIYLVENSRGPKTDEITAYVHADRHRRRLGRPLQMLVGELIGSAPLTLYEISGGTGHDRALPTDCLQVESASESKKPPLGWLLLLSD